MNLLNLEDEKFKNEKVGGYNFRIKFISPMDRISITQKRISFQGGNPIESLTQDEFIFFENCAIVDICTEKMPDSFNENESCIKWDSIELINELATRIRKHTNDIESKLKKNKPVDGGEQE